MNKFNFFLLLALLPFVAQAKLNVVATTQDFGAIAQEIGGDKPSCGRAHGRQLHHARAEGVERNVAGTAKCDQRNRAF